MANINMLMREAGFGSSSSWEASACPQMSSASYPYTRRLSREDSEKKLGFQRTRVGPITTHENSKEEGSCSFAISPSLSHGALRSGSVARLIAPLLLTILLVLSLALVDNDASGTATKETAISRRGNQKVLETEGRSLASLYLQGARSTTKRPSISSQHLDADNVVVVNDLYSMMRSNVLEVEDQLAEAHNKAQAESSRPRSLAELYASGTTSNAVEDQENEGYPKIENSMSYAATQVADTDTVGAEDGKGIDVEKRIDDTIVQTSGTTTAPRKKKNDPEVSMIAETVSVVIIAHGEHAYINRTVLSVVERTPATLLADIIVVDDSSDPPLDIQALEEATTVKKTKAAVDEKRSSWKLQVLRNSFREGLTRAKIQGAAAASGDVLFFLDAHVAMGENWHAPIFAHIRQNYRRVVQPFVAQLREEDWTIDFSAIGAKMMFDWRLHSDWFDDFKMGTRTEQVSHEGEVNEHEQNTSTSSSRMKMRNSHSQGEENIDILEQQVDANAIALEGAELINDDEEQDSIPILSGGIFGISREWWHESGAYDPGLHSWGSEHIEQSLRLWLCGGEIVLARKAVVGHLFRSKWPYFVNKTEMLLNRVRVVETWFGGRNNDFFRRLFYTVNKNITTTGSDTDSQHPPQHSWSNLRNQIGDLTDRLLLQERLQCGRFDSFVDRFRPILEQKGMVPRQSFLIRLVVGDATRTLALIALLSSKQLENTSRSRSVCLALAVVPPTSSSSDDKESANRLDFQWDAQKNASFRTLTSSIARAERFQELQLGVRVCDTQDAEQRFMWQYWGNHLESLGVKGYCLRGHPQFDEDANRLPIAPCVWNHAEQKYAVRLTSKGHMLFVHRSDSSPGAYPHSKNLHLSPPATTRTCLDAFRVNLMLPAAKEEWRLRASQTQCASVATFGFREEI
ncbi:unnamed protein product [Amoebophrya sp. A25]|nr:unnamed protein product [Amoebophrya sp. A25]|eukprot:GSA25T00000456001.1